MAVSRLHVPGPSRRVYKDGHPDVVGSFLFIINLQLPLTSNSFSSNGGHTPHTLDHSWFPFVPSSCSARPIPPKRRLSCSAESKVIAERDRKVPVKESCPLFPWSGGV